MAAPALLSLGIAPAASGTRESQIQEEEVKGVQMLYESFYDVGQNTAEQWTAAAEEGHRTLFFRPLSSEEMDAKIQAEIEGQTYPEKDPPSLAEVVAAQKQQSDTWYGRLIADIPSLSDEDLLAVRIKLTMQLAVIRTQEEHNSDSGMPQEILDLAREGATSARDAVNVELRKRGLTE